MVKQDRVEFPDANALIKDSLQDERDVLGFPKLKRKMPNGPKNEQVYQHTCESIANSESLIFIFSL